MTTVFGKIIRRELPADIVFENERIIAFRDIHPIAPDHILIVTKKEIPDLQSVAPEDLPLIGEMVAVAQQIARELGIDKGYRFITNNGSLAGQQVPHLHFHLIGGRKLNGLG
jgi:Diadenosine tetraphosphate (Ap4A) hydrolase and other HIT family hydrolases